MRSFVTIIVLLFTSIALPASHAEDAELHRERIEWCDIWFTDAEKDALPRVLMIGDSITRGYFAGVEKELGGKAYCGRLTTSRSVCDPVFFQELALVVGQYDFAVIHFNNGLHGWDYSEEEYRAGFEKFVAALKEQAPNAKLVCALSTPVLTIGGMAKHIDRVVERNAIATTICNAHDIAINDLYATSEAGDYHTGDGVHFNNKGKTAQAAAVGGAIRSALTE